jgi:hypothetical protein
MKAMGFSMEDSLISDGDGHKFCYVYWEHGRNGQAAIYYQDTPYPFGSPAYSRFEPKRDFREFVKQLKLKGWQTFMMKGTQEAYEAWLMRLPKLDAQYEYCVLSSTVIPNKPQPPQRENLSRLGDDAKLLPDAMWNADYAAVLKYLESEHWEFTHKEAYPAHRDSTSQLQLQFYKRRAASSNEPPVRYDAF